MIRTNSQRGRSYARYLAHYTKRNSSLLLLGALFLAGVLFGSMLLRTAGGDTLSALLRVVNGYTDTRREQSILHNLISASASSLTFVAVMFVSGFCAISQPLILATPLFRGLGFGISAASLYASHGAPATVFIALFILPDMLLSSLAILLCCRESLRLSGNFWNIMWNNPGKEPYSFRIYTGRYVAASILCVVSAFIEAVLHFVFANLIVLG